MANFTAAGRLKDLPDIQKNYMWELFIPSIEDLDQDDMVIRCRTASIPGRTIAPIESNFMGTKQFYPGKSKYTGNLAIQLEEFEDQKVHQALHSWMQSIFDYDPKSGTAGQSKAAGKNDYSVDVTLKLYKGDGSDVDKKIRFYNCWPTSVGDAALDYAGPDSVKYDVTFQFDYWLPVQ